jgi:hypothetical protein
LWAGTNWTEVNDLNTGREGLRGGGTYTSAVAFAGNNPSTTNVAVTESWNGTNWTEVNDLNTARRSVAGAGASNTSALCFAGDILPGSPRPQDLTESWNGTNWTEVNDLNTGRIIPGGTGIANSSI